MQPEMSLLEVESNQSRSLQDADSGRVSWKLKGAWFLHGVGLACITLIALAAWQHGMPDASSDIAKTSQLAFDVQNQHEGPRREFDLKPSKPKVNDPAAFDPATVALDGDSRDRKNPMQMSLTKKLWEERQQMKKVTTDKNGKPHDFKTEQRFAAAAAASMLLVGVANPLPALAEATGAGVGITSETRQQLSYLQTKGTGLANRCNNVVKVENDPSTGLPGAKAQTIKVGQGARLIDFCVEPKQFFVEEEVADRNTGNVQAKYVPTKLMTRETYTLDGMSGTFTQKDGKLQVKEEDGIDYAPTTVQMPGGERVPFLFTMKDLKAIGGKDGYDIKPGYEFGGRFQVPSYRTGLFLDPKGRGMTTGYDMAQALGALQTGEEGDSRLANENDKKYDVLPGSVEFEVQSVNGDLSEFGGVFVSTQPGDTDQGTAKPKKILLKGIFYGKVEPENTVVETTGSQTAFGR